MKRNEIVTRLLKEGFSEKTLVNMSDKQLKLLSDRIINEQQNNNVTVSGKTPDLTNVVTKLKQSGNNITVAEEEIDEDMMTGGEFAGALGIVLAAFGAAGVNQGKHYYSEFLKRHPEDKKGAVRFAIKKVIDGINVSGLNEQKKSEVKEIETWVDLMVENEYNSVTTKNEIMDLIKTKMNEGNWETEVAEPEIEVEPDVDTPEVAPGPDPDADPYIDPWKDPGTTPDPRPKFKKHDHKHKGEHESFPEFLKFNNILHSVNENKVSKITNIVLNQIKKKS